MIYQSPHPPVALTGETITERLFRGLVPGPAIIDGVTGRTVTGAELEDSIRRLAGGLAARGIGPGHTVAIMAPNAPDYAIAFHGPLLAGATVTTINPTYTVPEVRHQLTDSGANLMIAHPAVLDTARAAAEGTGVTTILTMDALADAMGAPLARQVPVDVTAHTAVLPYSSGTTGLPKGVMLTHRNLVVNVDQTAVTLDAGPGDWTVAFLPFFHIYGQTVLMNMHLAIGAGIVTMPRFDLELFLKLVTAHRTRQVFCAPPVVVALAKHPMVDQFDLTCVERLFSGAAPLGGEVAEAVGRRLGCIACQGYGMTEMAPVSHAMPAGQTRPGSVGKALPNTECRLVDPATGQDAEAGGEGELWVRGPQVMKGYHNNPTATAATLTPDGWLRTGDLAAIEPDGYFAIRDRVKELIKVSGFQVAPAELEAELLTHPAVADCAVIGKPDDAAGEVPVAFVVLQKGAAADPDPIMAHLAGRLASYKQLRAVHFTDVIPKSPSGKILRRLLRDRA